MLWLDHKQSACSEDKGESAEDRAVRLGEMLLAAAAAGATAAVQILLGAGAPLNSALPDGRTALMLAAGSGHQKTTQALLHAGALATLSVCMHRQPWDLDQ